MALTLFGLLVTLALLLYNERNNQLYNELVGRAASIERELGLPDGAFANRPAAWFSIGRVRVDHGTAIGTIYAATSALWLYGTLSSALVLLWEAGAQERQHQAVPSWVGAVALPLAFVVAFGAWLLLRRHAKVRGRSMRELARGAVAAAVRVEPFDVRRVALDADFLACCARLAGPATTTEKLTRKADSYARLDAQELLLYLPGPPAPVDARGKERAAAHLTALLTDLPSRWIDDVASGRRG